MHHADEHMSPLQLVPGLPEPSPLVGLSPLDRASLRTEVVSFTVIPTAQKHQIQMCQLNVPQ